MRRPAYETLYDLLRLKIISGDYPYGSRLPGKRTLAEEQGLSVITVAHALDLLAEEGYIAPRERSGCYVSYLRAEDMASVRKKPGTMIPGASAPRTSSADMDGFPFHILSRTMRRVLSEQGPAILEKTPGQGLLLLRQALSRYLSRSSGIEAAPGQIVLGAGAEYLYGLLAELLGRQGVWAIEYPSYEKIDQVYTARGLSLDRLPLAGDGLQSEALWRTSARVLHVSPYRSFPSDITASASKRAEYLLWGADPGKIIIEDDYESEFSVRRKPMAPLFVQSERENVIYMNTFSRTISPALRIGYIILPPPLLPLYQEKAGFYSCTVPAFEQFLLTYLLEQGDLERHIRRVRRKLKALQAKQ